MHEQRSSKNHHVRVVIYPRLYSVLIAPFEENSLAILRFKRTLQLLINLSPLSISPAVQSPCIRLSVDWSTFIYRQ